MDELSRETIDRCLAGDMEAFSRMVQSYERPVYGFIYRILRHTRHSMSAEDAVQEVFLKAYEKMHTYDPERGAKFSTWLFAVARNHCISLLRKRSVESGGEELDEEKLAALPDSRLPDPREAARARELGERVGRAVAALPERIRSAFVLRHYEALSYEEIGGIMGCSPGTVKSRVNRAKAKLMQELEGQL